MSDDFVEVAWKCPACDTENRGRDESCQNCGKNQPFEVEFYIPDGPIVFVTDPDQLAEAASGPDIHCGFCSTRNSHESKTCTQCGAPLEGGQVRKAGDNLDTADDEGISPSAYNQVTEEDDSLDFSSPDLWPGTITDTSEAWPTPSYQPVSSNHRAVKSSPPRLHISREKLRIAALISLTVLIVSIIGYLFWNTFFNVTPEQVQIQSFSWHLTVPVGEIMTFHEKGDSVPDGGRVTSTVQVETGEYEQKNDTVQEKVTDAQECGTHMENQGNGYAKVVPNSCYVSVTVKVDDHSKPKYKTVYNYDIDRWEETRTVESRGNDNKPEWPLVTLAAGESEGDRSEWYTVVYIDGQEVTHSYTTANKTWFISLKLKQVCTANRNGWGGLNPGLDCSGE